MSFNGFIWDIDDKSLLSLLDTPKPVVLFCKNILISKIISELYRKVHPEAKSLWGHDLNKSKLESLLEGLPLFGEKTTYLFLHLKKQIGADVLETLTHEISNNATHFYHFDSTSLAKKKLKGLDFIEISIKEMQQWHITKLIDYLCQKFQLKINSSDRSELSQWPIEDSLSLYQNLQNFSLGMTDLQKIKKNNFFISDLFCSKDLSLLYRELIHLAETDNSGKIFQVLSLLRGMIIKCTDKDFLKSAQKKTKYIQNLQRAQNQYSPLELSSLMKEISSLEIMFKISPEQGVRLLKNLVFSK